jgi:SHS2 domain-containing protein
VRPAAPARERCSVPYRYLDDIATADVAFEAWGDTPAAMLVAAGDATMNVMVADLAAIGRETRRSIELREETMEFVLFALLGELIYYKDAECLLLRFDTVAIEEEEGRLVVRAEASGEAIDRSRHELLVDVKAVTFHRLAVEDAAEGWRARVILDI